MYPKGPAANPVTKTGTAENAPLPSYAACKNNGAKKAALFAGEGMQTITFAANPEQYGTNGYWK